MPLRPSPITLWLPFIGIALAWPATSRASSDCPDARRTTGALSHGAVRSLTQSVCPVVELGPLASAERAYLESRPTEAPPETDREIRGVRVRGTVTEFDILSRAVSDHPPAHWPKAAQGCNDVFCALVALAGGGDSGREAAFRILAIAHRHGYTVSFDQRAYAYPGEDPGSLSAVWQPSEIRTVHETLDRLPPSFRRMPHLIEIKRQKMINAVGGLNAWSSIVLRHVSPSTLLHELAHSMDFTTTDGIYSPVNGWIKHPPSATANDRLMRSAQAEWLDFSEWRKIEQSEQCIDGFYRVVATATEPQFSPPREPCSAGSPPRVQSVWRHSGRESFTAYDTTPLEDFADGILFYLTLPAVIAQFAPSKYQYLKDRIFQGATPETSGYLIAPAVRRSFQETFMAGQGFMKCVDQISRIEITSDSATDTIHMLARDGNQAPWRGAASIHCLSDAKTALLAHMSPDDVCFAGGAAVVEQQLKELLDEWFDTIPMLLYSDLRLRPDRCPRSLARDARWDCLLGGLRRAYTENVRLRGRLTPTAVDSLISALRTKTH